METDIPSPAMVSVFILAKPFRLHTRRGSTLAFVWSRADECTVFFTAQGRPCSLKSNRISLALNSGWHNACRLILRTPTCVVRLTLLLFGCEGFLKYKCSVQTALCLILQWSILSFFYFFNQTNLKSSSCSFNPDFKLGNGCSVLIFKCSSLKPHF